MTKAEKKELIDRIYGLLKAYKQDMDEWAYMEYDGHKYTYEELAPEMMGTLRKLRLESEGADSK